MKSSNYITAMCVKNTNLEFSLTVGKVYTIRFNNSKHYGLYNDNGFYSYYHSSFFKNIVKFRNDIINEILE